MVIKAVKIIHFGAESNSRGRRRGAIVGGSGRAVGKLGWPITGGLVMDTVPLY